MQEVRTERFNGVEVDGTRWRRAGLGSWRAGGRWGGAGQAI